MMKADTCHRKRNRDLSRQSPSRRRLILEALEPRRLLANITVTTHLDTIDTDLQITSLREAIMQANENPGDDTILFSPQVVNHGVIELTNSQRQADGSHFWIKESLTIRGPGADKLTIDANRQARHFLVTTVDRFVEVEILGLTLTQGAAPSGGGSIAVQDARLTVKESEITHNTAADDGGAIILQAELRRPGDRMLPAVVIDQSTIAYNKALNSPGLPAHGGGISVVGFPDQDDPSKTVVPVLEIDNSTISNNGAEEEGGAIFLDDANGLLRHVTVTGNVTNSDGGIFDPLQRNADLTLINSIVAGNVRGPGAIPHDIAEFEEYITVDTDRSKNNLIGDAATSGGLRDKVMENIVGINDIGVRPINEILNTLLQDNGGTTRTHALVPGSVAIDAAMDLFGFDQRKERREKNESDIGSFEADTAIVSIATTADGSEDGPTNGEFTVTQSATRTFDLEISYTVSGTAKEGDDYKPLSGSVTIEAGSPSATIDVEPFDDALVEELETVIVTLDEITSGGAGVKIDGSNKEATVELTDNDSAMASIARTKDGDEEGPVNGEFKVTLTAASATDTEIRYSVSSTALPGVDYRTLTNTVTIPKYNPSDPEYEPSATIDVEVLDDTFEEETDTLTLRLTSIMSGDSDITIDPVHDEASINIFDNDVPFNKRPSFTASNPPAVAENAGRQTVTGFATFNPGDPSESSQSVLVYTVSGVTNPDLFAVPPAIDKDGNLTYTPATDAIGMSDFTVVVQDDGGTANGGIDTSDPQTFTVTVDPASYCAGVDDWCSGPWRANVVMLDESNLPAMQITLRNPQDATDSKDILGNGLEIYHETNSEEAPLTQVFLTNGFSRPTSQGGSLLSSLHGFQFFSSANNHIDEPVATRIELMGVTAEGYLQVQTELLAEDATAGDSFTVTNEYELHQPTSLNTITDVTVQIANTSGRDVMPAAGIDGELHRALSEQWVPISFNSMFVSQDWESVTTLPDWYTTLDPNGDYVNEEKINNGDPLDDGRSVNGNIDVSTHDVAFIDTEVGTTTLDHETLQPIEVPNFEFFEDLVVYREQSDFVQLRHAHDAARNQHVEITDISGLVDTADGFKWSVIYDRDDANLVDGDNIQVRLTMDEMLGAWPMDAVQSLSFRVTSGDATVNRDPVINSAAAASVLENQTSAIDVAATDEDNDTLTYAITGGADRNTFAIDSDTGVVTFNAAPDFENPTDAGANNVYDIQVTVSDGNGGSALQDIAITVTDVNEQVIITSAIPDGLDDPRLPKGSPPTSSGFSEAACGWSNSIFPV